MLLERGFPLMWIQGEISNLTIASSGHWYFTLKDSKAQVQSAMFRTRNRLTRLKPENGLEVLVRARVTLYEPRGNYQLVVDHIEEAGAGVLQRQYEELKQKLNLEGLFATEHKKPLPALPRTIGVISSPTGAAIRDVLSVLKRRFAATDIILYPVQVQGEQAPGQICRAIGLARSRNECDVLLITRGGGSLEDLWAFNDEQVARAIYHCPIPTVSAVGHEIDFTIADFVADVRAPTPSAAAELLSPDQQTIKQRLQQIGSRLVSLQLQQITQHQRALKSIRARLQHPSRLLQQQNQRVDELDSRLQRGFKHRQLQAQSQLQRLTMRLQQHNPRNLLTQTRYQLDYLKQRLYKAQTLILYNAEQRLAKNSHALDIVSPLATLSRGYAIVQKTDKQHTVVRNIEQIEVGDRLRTRLSSGHIISEVKETLND